MADYIGNANISFGGTAKTYHIYYQYDIGDILYIKYKIIIDEIMEKVAIKKIILSDGAPVVYIDTFNRAWLTGELLYEDDAINLLNESS